MGLGAVIAPPCTLRASLPLPAPRRQHCCWSGGEEGGGGRNAAPGAGRVPPRRAAEGGSNFDCFIAGMNLASLILDVASSLPGLIVSSVSPSPPAGGRDLRHAAPVRRSHRHPRRLAVGSGHATERQQGRRGLAVVYCSRLQRDSASNWVASTAGPWLGRFSGAVWACCRVVPLQS